MNSDQPEDPSWADRAAARSPVVQRTRTRSIQQARQIIDAAIELVAERGSAFTIQELAKQARVALQTFYRHFAGKDELLLAVIEQTIADNMVTFEAQARDLPDAMARLRHYITVAILSLDDAGTETSRRFITAEHYRLHQLFPDELSEANRAYTDLLIPEILEATAAGHLAPNDVDTDAWFVTELVMATFHHYAYATNPMPTEVLSERLWRFCLAALGGSAPTSPSPPATPAKAKTKAKTTKKAATARVRPVPASTSAARSGARSAADRTSGRSATT